MESVFAANRETFTGVNDPHKNLPPEPCGPCGPPSQAQSLMKSGIATNHQTFFRGRDPIKKQEPFSFNRDR